MSTWADWSASGTVRSGAGGATKAFLHAGGRRMDEIEAAIGVRVVPGSLNVHIDRRFPWVRAPHIVAEILDVERRGRGLEVPWRPRTARLYPVSVDGVDAWAFRFDGERYPDTFVELVAPVQLRDHVSERVTLRIREVRS